jgi:hypothetical protein
MSRPHAAPSGGTLDDRGPAVERFFFQRIGDSAYSGFQYIPISGCMDIAMEQDNSKQLFFRPVTGSVLAVVAGLSFFVLCMILPLVGPAGSRVEHAGQNRAAFTAVLLVTLALAAASTWSKLGCRKQFGGTLPWFSLGLVAVCVLTFFVLVAGGFRI